MLNCDEMFSSSDIKLKTESSNPKKIKIKNEKYRDRFIKYK